MTKDPVDLDRKLFPLTSGQWNDFDEDLAAAKQLHVAWSDLYHNPVSFVIAPANYGKTEQFRLAAHEARNKGIPACLIPMRELALESPQAVVCLFESPELSALKLWKVDRHGPAYVFIDALDEAQAVSPVELLRTFRILADHVGNGPGLRWVLSTRPAMATADYFYDVFETLTNVHTDPKRASTRTTATSSNAVPFRAYRLSKLSREQAESYISAVLKIPSPGKMAQEIRDSGLGYLLDSPGGLNLADELRCAVLKNPTLLELYRFCEMHYTEIEDSNAQTQIRITPRQREREIRRLAMGCVLTKKLNIAAPGASDQTRTSLLARTLVRGLLKSELLHLLTCSPFKDSGYNQVKIQPDDFLAYLAACRLNELITAGSDAEKVLTQLCWRAANGETGIFADFLPTAGWLATINQYFFDKCLALDPQCVAFYGDMRSVPLERAERALLAAFNSLDASESGTGYELPLPNKPLAWPNHALIHTAMRKLFQTCQSGIARETLLRVAAHSCIPNLAAIVVETRTKKSVPIPERILLEEYIVAAEQPGYVQNFIATTLKRSRVPSRTICLLIENCLWTKMSSTELLLLLSNSELENANCLDIRAALSSVMKANRSVNEAGVLCELLISEIESLGSPSSGIAAVVPTWLLPITALALKHLAGMNLLGDAFEDTAELVARLQLAVQKLPLQVDHELDDIETTIERPNALREAVVRKLTAITDTEADFGKTFYGHNSLMLPKVTDVLESQSDAFNSWVRSIHEAPSVVVSMDGSPNPTPQASFKTRAPVADRQDFRLPTGGPSIEAIAHAIFNELRNTELGDIAESDLRAVFSAADAFFMTQSLNSIWQGKAPTAAPGSLDAATVAGLVSLSLGIAESGLAAMVVTTKDVTRALAYGLFQTNGLPKWFWNCALIHPEAAATYVSDLLTSNTARTENHPFIVKILVHLKDCPRPFMTGIKTAAWTAIYETAGLLPFHLDSALSGILSMVVPTATFAEEATRRMLADITSETAASWGTAWLGVEPHSFMKEFRTFQRRDAPGSKTLITNIAAKIELEHQGTILRDERDTLIFVTAIKQLYLAIEWALAATPEPSYGSGFRIVGAGDPISVRRLLDRLPSMISAVGGTAAHLALLKLGSKASDRWRRASLLKLARATLERSLRRNPLSERAVLTFEETLKTAAGSEEGFAAEIDDALAHIKEEIEQGQFSTRRFFSSLFTGLDKKAYRSLEEDFQLFLAHQLSSLGGHRFGVVQEEQLAESTRRDITILNTRREWKATLELKVSGSDWTFEDYRLALKNQLVGQYMKHRGSKVGYLVIVLQKSRTWNFRKRRIDFDGLIDALRREAKAIEHSKPELRIRVIGIDSREPIKASRPATSRNRL